MAQSASVVSTEDEARYVEAERACVGAVLGAPSLWHSAIEKLRPLDFAHRAAYVMFDALDNELDRRTSGLPFTRPRREPISYVELLAYAQRDPRVSLAEKWRVTPREFGHCLYAASDAGCLDRLTNENRILSQHAVHAFAESARTVLDGRLRRELIAAADGIDEGLKSDVDPAQSSPPTAEMINQRCHPVRDIAGRLENIGSVGRWPYQGMLLTSPVFPAADVRREEATAAFGTEIAAEFRRLAGLPADRRQTRVKGVMAASSAVWRFQDRLESVAAKSSLTQLRRQLSQAGPTRKPPGRHGRARS